MPYRSIPALAADAAVSPERLNARTPDPPNPGQELNRSGTGLPGTNPSRPGEPVSAERLRELYERTDFEDHLLLPDRVEAMCADLFEQLIATGGPEHIAELTIERSNAKIAKDAKAVQLQRAARAAVTAGDGRRKATLTGGSGAGTNAR